MNIGMHRAISGCMVQQEKLTATSVNLANAHTVGFKTTCLSMASRNQAAQVDEKAIDFSEGMKRNTFHKLDLALEGKGFFVIQTPKGLAYTRKGNFTLNAEGTLVTQEGLPVLGQKGPIQVHGHDFGVSGDGAVMVDGFQVDKLRLAGFSPSSPFETGTGTLFFKKDPNIKEQPATGTVVRQGQLELSNVNIMKEMTRLIEISAHYESCQKMIQTIDEMDQKVINETGRI